MIDEDGCVKNTKEEIDPYNEEKWEEEIDDVNPVVEEISWSKKILSFIIKIGPVSLFILMIASIIGGVFSCNSRSKRIHKTELYFNEYFIVKEKIPERKVLIIQRLSDTNYFTELPGHNLSLGNWDSIYYSKKVGDKLYFEYIRKDRFFKTTNGTINK